jgi:hypothetical protein
VSASTTSQHTSRCARLLFEFSKTDVSKLKSARNDDEHDEIDGDVERNLNNLYPCDKVSKRGECFCFLLIVGASKTTIMTMPMCN